MTSEAITLSSRETRCARCEHGVGVNLHGYGRGIECVWHRSHAPLPDHGLPRVVVSLDTFSRSPECPTPNYDTSLSPNVPIDRICPVWEPRTRPGTWRDDVMESERAHAEIAFRDDPGRMTTNETIEQAIARHLRFIKEELDGFAEATV